MGDYPMRNPELYCADHLTKWETQTEVIIYDHRNIPVRCDWAAARPLGRTGPFWHRFKLAWLVLTGKCDVVKWYKQ
jgi:hypothetical protein